MNICPSCGSEQPHQREECAECSQPLDLNGKYRLIKLMNKGMAETFLAVAEHEPDAEVGEDDPTKARFVVKKINVADLDDWKHLELFKREAAVLSRLQHQNIPRYIDHFADEEEGAFYLVQTYVSAPSVEDVAVKAGFDEAKVFDIGRQVLDILEYLHSLEPPVIHRDIKPDNLLYDSDGHVWLVDFGTVRAAIQNKTVGGTTVVGTLGYMAPEQFYGQATPSTDLFGLGATMLRLLTGKHPADFPHDGIEINLAGQLDHLSPRARVAIASLMRPRPSERPQSVNDARRLFGRLGSGQGLEHVRPDSGSLADAINQAADFLNRSLKGHPPAQRSPRAQKATNALETGVNVFGNLVDALASGIDVATRPLTRSQRALPPPQQQRALPPPQQQPTPDSTRRQAGHRHLPMRREGDKMPAKKWTPMTIGAIVIGIILFFFLL